MTLSEPLIFKILSLGGKTALPKFAVPGVCWQGYFIDTEGNTFGLFQLMRQQSKIKSIDSYLA